MKTLWINSVGGASGDMILGALIGLGADASAIEAALEPLVGRAVRLETTPFAGHGLTGLQLRVSVAGEDGAGVHEHAAGAAKEGAPPPAHGHGHGAEPADGHPGGPGEHGHRSYREIQARIEASDLPDAVRRDSLAVFARLAAAEGAIHGRPPEEVSFHEVGAWDSIADIVGAGLARHTLGIDAVRVDALPLGRGTLRCRHGLYPVPAPATLELLKGFPTVPTDEEAELVTPTGAALLTTWATTFPAPAEVARATATAYSFGHRALPGRPNVLRAVLLETGAADAPGRCLVMETNLDDTTPEIVGALSVRLLERGALDVFTAPVQMKKQRPGMLLTVLARPSDREQLLDAIFRESTTFGVRMHEVERAVLARSVETVATRYGPVRVKVGAWRGEVVTRSPEMEDCIALARAAGVPVRAVYEAARAGGPSD